MQHKKEITDIGPDNAVSKGSLKSLLKIIGTLGRTGMQAGNNGDFDKAFLNLEDALSLTRDLNKKCLEAKLLNNLGTLHTMNGSWDRAMIVYEEAVDIVSAH
jgi:tetratricopeptide (TPR) repeat protein